MTMVHAERVRLSVLAGASGLAMLVATPGLAQAADPAPNPAITGNQTATGSDGVAVDSGKQADIVVTGIRGSLDKSLRIKRDSAVVVDSINATELGRFPDSDVADSLQHITGITINRTTGGEGQYVSVRGLGSQYNITTLNDRILATDDDGRDFAFDILPSDVISGADVLKSPEASAIEGSIGGTVNLRSARPFDHPGFHAVARVEGNYNDMSHDKGYKASGFISDTNSAGTLGFLFGAVYSDQKFRTDSLNYATYDPDYPGTWPPPSADGTPAPGAQPVVGLCCIQFGSVVDRKKRIALTGALEWKPSDRLHIVLDGMFTKLHDPQVAYNQSYYPDFTYDQNGNPEWSNVTTSKDGIVTGFTGTNFTPEVVNQTIHRVVNTYLIGLNTTWEATSRLTLRGDVYRSHASRPEGGQDAFVTAGLVSPTPYNQNIITYSANKNAMPDITVTLPDGSDYATDLASGKLDDQSLWSTHYVGLSGYSIKDTVTGAKLDATYEVGGILKHIDVGVNYNTRSKSRTDISNDWTNGSNQYSSLYNTLDGQPGPITFASMGANVISTFNFPNYFSGAGGSFPRTQVLLNIPALLEGLKKLDGTPNYTAGSGTYLFANTLPQYNAVNSYVVREKTISGYLQATLGGPSWSGNIGVRLVHTTTSAATAVDNILSVTVDDTANPTNAGVVQYSAPTALVAHGNYTLALPSVNLNYHFTDRLQLRLAGAEVVSRPNLNQLAPTETDNALNQDYTVTYAGNAALKPIKAWQADASLEWYYHPNDMVSVALFKKWLRDDITTVERNSVDIGAVGCFNGDACTTLPFSVIEPINGDTAQIYGIEFSWQHMLSNGLGIRAQFTHTWSKTRIDGVSVGAEEGVSPTTFSINPFYEHGPISLSVSWDHTSPFVYATFTEVDGYSAYAKSYDWVTASASYNITKQLRVYVEGKNLTNAIVRTYLNHNPYAIWASGTTGTSSSVGAGYSAYGRTLTAGIRFGF
jgi:TonB-dependent receptor